MFEFQLGETCGARHVLLHVDCGSGFDPAVSITLPLRRGKVAKRICYFPGPVRAVELKFSGVAGEGEYEVAHCCLAWLAPHFARDRLCQRLANMHRNYRGESRQSVRKALSKEAQASGRSWRSVALLHYSETFHKRCPQAGYAEWLAQVETEQLPGTDEVVALAACLPPPALFTLRMRVTLHALDSAWLAMRSLLSQSYPRWRLLLEVSGDLLAAPGPALARLHETALGDERIVLQEEGREISGQFSCASGEPVYAHFVSELPSVGRLHTHALYFAAKAISESPDVQLLYTDGDTLNRAGSREAPLFRPAWNPDLLLACNYVGQCCFFHNELLQSLGRGFPAARGITIYDALLQCRELLNADDVKHIPRVLYHQKVMPVADRQLLESAEKNVLKHYLAEAGIPAELESWQSTEGQGTPSARLRWAIPKPVPMVSLLVPTRDGVDILRQCVDSILQKTEYPNYEILILDNQSRCSKTLAYFREVQRDSRVRVHQWNHPFNYSAINNFGASLARGSVLGLINNDIEVITPGWLCEMVGHACREEIGCVGAKLYYGNDTLQHGGVILGIGGTAGHSHKYALRDAAGYMGRLQVVQNLSAVTGACLVLRKSVFEQVGGLNEADLAIAYNDVDLCLKVREAGYRNLWTPYAELYHHESVSRGADDTTAKRRRAQREADYMRRRWGNQLDTDPAYNPNLTLIHEDFSLA
ncbi:glycosyltransferase [Microbulbifer sp. YPW1]|uniref:glycosyltransferase family 2 protein n=1 Tax=Microbulbifer sp. YPW1 TaxID=2745199 RepID=UPI001597ADB8|nr:glycosyltransferase family 2 protein [Microbulbifer sp. YPW1]QKX15825.1 glycosyltransferase [Microbulbifer sp. YPW1]